MIKLEKIFDMEDAAARQKALVEYAKLLRVNTLKAKKPDGSFSENELAVLIYNAEQSIKNFKFQTIALFVVAILILVAVLAGIGLFKMMMSRQ